MYVICLPTKQELTRTRSEMAVLSRIELEFGNVTLVFEVRSMLTRTAKEQKWDFRCVKSSFESID